MATVERLLSAAASDRTRRRWQKHGIPRRARAAAGDLGAIDPDWAGWRLVRGELVSPDGVTFRPGEVACIPVRMQQIACLIAETRPGTQRELL